MEANSYCWEDIKWSHYLTTASVQFKAHDRQKVCSVLAKNYPNFSKSECLMLAYNFSICKGGQI